MSHYTQVLHELTPNCTPSVGGKAANLGVLLQAGLPVPPGFVVTTNAYRAHLEASGLRKRIAAALAPLAEGDSAALTEASAAISAWITEAPMPAEVQAEVIQAFEHLSEAIGCDTHLAVAVRSSATGEDGESASFAGQHETYLGVYGTAAILSHVKKCWASLWNPQALSYRTRMGFEHLAVDLAVVVQAMIDSEAAGVMFTANPVNGKRDEILVSAGYGLGETVVSGLITPDTFVLAKDGGIAQQTLGTKELRMRLTETGTLTEDVPPVQRAAYCLGANELKQLADLARRVERHYGNPMDTEWALGRGTVFLLQARPITTLRVCEEAELLGPGDPILYSGKKLSMGLEAAIEYFPDPVTPLDLAILTQRLRAFNMLLGDVGLGVPQAPVTLVERASGCVAIRLGKTGLSPALLWKAPVFLTQSLVKNVSDTWQPVAEDMRVWRARVEAATQTAHNAQATAELLTRALNEFGALVHRRFASAINLGMVAEYRFDRLVKQAVGKRNAVELRERLLRALPFNTALQNQAVVELARTAALHGKESSAFHGLFDTFMQTYGDRPATSVAPLLATPTWRETPAMVHELIDALLRDTTLLHAEDDFAEQRADYEAANMEVRRLLKPGAYQKFQSALENARNAVIIREESSFLVEQLTACLRRVALKLGDLLAQASVIHEADDVFFLLPDELGPAADGRLAVRAQIAHRKRAFAQVRAAHDKGIHWLVATGSARVHGAQRNHSNTSNSLQGSAASRGVYEGSVCIVRGPSQFTKLKPGDILVAPYTAPAWTPLFRVASAVVTERGSATSHAAIVAREYGIPAVVAIENVTHNIKDGQRIRVDGTQGTITLLS